MSLDILLLHHSNYSFNVWEQVYTVHTNLKESYSWTYYCCTILDLTHLMYGSECTLYTVHTNLKESYSWT